MDIFSSNPKKNDSRDEVFGFFEGNDNGKYPKNRDQFNAQDSGKPDEVGKALNELFQEVCVLGGMGTWFLLKSLFSQYAPLTLAILGFIVWFGYYAATEALLFRFLYWSDPNVFTPEIIMYLYKVHRDYWWIGISSILFLATIVPVGAYARSIVTKYRLIFQTAGLKNGIGETPKLIKKKKLDEFRTKYIFDNVGIDLHTFENKRDSLEAIFRENIESIKYGQHKGQIEIISNKQDFPENLTYSELSSGMDLPPNSFFIGHSADGILTQDIAELPHMLIAGTTGSGKSTFFKQVLMGLLESSPYIQMYLIDLKGGVEMTDFDGLPNVQIVKSFDEALNVFKEIEREMKERFSYLQKKGKKQIVPSIDGKDRIVVAVDEASIMYMDKWRGDDDKKKVLEARRVCDSVAKSSRAAAIHVLLATQKLENQAIPTSVTENISGRMMFRANSFQGSSQVIGTKDALMLPEIPGRGIWSFGTSKLTIQAPFIDEATIQSGCSQIAKDFEKNVRKCFRPVIGKVEEEVEAQTQDRADELVKPKKEHDEENDSE